MKKKEPRKERIKKAAKSITISILDILLSMAENFVISMDRKEARKAVYGYRENEWSVRKIGQYFDSLQRRGYLEVENRKGKESIKFTNKAKMALLDTISARTMEENRYHFVSFDIPEPSRRNRDRFRRGIKCLGYREVQKSLWVSKKDVGELVEILAKEYKVSPYIAYFVTEITNIDIALEKILKKKPKRKDK